MHISQISVLVYSRPQSAPGHLLWGEKRSQHSGMRWLGPKLTEGRATMSVCTRKESEGQVGLRKKERRKKSVKKRQLANTLCHSLNCSWRQATNHLIMFKQRRGIWVILASPEIPWAPDLLQTLSSVLSSRMTKGGAYLCPAPGSFRTRKQARQHSPLRGNLTC